MKQQRPFNIHLFLTATFIVISLGLFLLAGSSVERAIESHSLWKLSTQATTGIESLTADLAYKSSQADSLRIIAQELIERSLPTLSDFKQLVSSQRLELTNIEQVSTNSRNNQNGLRYRVSISGRVGQLTRLLKSFEENFVAEINQLQLFPVDDSGEKIMMRFVFEVAK